MENAENRQTFRRLWSSSRCEQRWLDDIEKDLHRLVYDYHHHDHEYVDNDDHDDYDDIEKDLHNLVYDYEHHGMVVKVLHYDS